MTDFILLLSYRLTFRDHVAQTLWLSELIVTLADVTLAFIELPLLETACGNVFSEQHVEGGVDWLQRVIANEDNGVKAFEDHADFCRRVPAVVAA